MKILVVEDASATLLIVTKFIERFGAKPIAVSNGEEAISAFRHQQPDMVLLDAQLPDIDGFSVARQMRALEKPGAWTPIIFLSGMTSDKDLEKGIAAGGDDYLYKPVSEAVLCAKIRAMQRIIQMRTSLVVLARELDAANQELKRLSASDGLTGIANRRFFDEYFSREWRRARRGSGEISILMCDVDHFKAYNDTYGHQAGDDCLRQVAHKIRDSMERAADLAARYGGEEFVVLLPDTPIAGASMVAEKIRQAVHALALVHSGSAHHHITLSIGVAAMSADNINTPQTLIEAADRALYQAKDAGRNRVCHHAPELDIEA